MIKVDAVSKNYGKQSALDDMSFEVPDGQVVGILGENGAGKTTLLKAISCLTLYEGNITFDDISSLKERNEKIAFITEEGSFFPFMTPRQNAEFFADFYGQFDMSRFQKLVQFFKLPIDKKARTFSKGQKAKLEIALGFSKGAKYLLLDEPFLGNDIFTRRDFLRLMCDSLIQDETILIATHLVDEIENFIDRALLIKHGSIKEDIDIDKMKESGDTLENRVKIAFQYDEDRFKRIFNEE